MKLKRDRIFVVVLAIVIANLSYGLITNLLNITLSERWADLSRWLLVIANVIGITGALWLLQSYRRGRRIAKEKETREKEESPSPEETEQTS